jgi:hypothetical protein
MTTPETVWIVLLGSEDDEGAIEDTVVEQVYGSRALADEYVALCDEFDPDRQPGAIPRKPGDQGNETRWVEAWDVRARLWDESEE